MKKLLLILFLSIAYLCTTHAQSFTKLEVKQSMRRVADWQIGHYNRAVYGDLNWVNATFFLGLAYWAEIAEKDDQDDFYYKWLTRLGSRNYWQVDKRMYHADDICIAQTYLYLYEKYKQKDMIVPTLARTEWVVANPPSGSFQLTYGDATTLEHWTWCDALFMAPPVYLKLYNITGDKKFIRFMDKEYKATYEFLFDKEENLFYRDHRYFDMKRWRIADITWNGNTDNDKAIVYGLYPYRIAVAKPGTQDQDKYIFVKTRSERFKVARTFQQSNYYSFIADDVINNNPTIVKNPFQ